MKTFPELVAYGKANPGKLNFASAGIGTTPHLAGELFKLRTGVDATHVPYRGIGASYTDLMSGKVQMAFSSIAGALPFTTDNRVRAIADHGNDAEQRLPRSAHRRRVRSCRIRSRSVAGSVRARLPAGAGAGTFERRAQRSAWRLPT